MSDKTKTILVFIAGIILGPPLGVLIAFIIWNGWIELGQILKLILGS